MRNKSKILKKIHEEIKKGTEVLTV